LSQRQIVIERDETIGTLYEKIEALGLELLSQQLPMLAKGEARLTSQNHAAARWFPPRTLKDGVIDWSVDSSLVDRFVRAQTHPYPGAFTTLKEKELRIWTADNVASENSLGTPGTVTHLRTVTTLLAGRGNCGSIALISRHRSTREEP
jgi:methionyl-tRNA formyltransferase